MQTNGSDIAHHCQFEFMEVMRCVLAAIQSAILAHWYLVLCPDCISIKSYHDEFKHNKTNMRFALGSAIGSRFFYGIDRSFLQC